jgi:hypothetical protein
MFLKNSCRAHARIASQAGPLGRRTLCSLMLPWLAAQWRDATKKTWGPDTLSEWFAYDRAAAGMGDRAVVHCELGSNVQQHHFRLDR